VEVLLYPLQAALSPMKLLSHYSIAHTKFSTSGKILVVVSQDGNLGIWDTAVFIDNAEYDFPLLWHTLLESNLRVTSVAISPDDKYVAVGCWDGSAVVFQSSEHMTVWNKVLFPRKPRVGGLDPVYAPTLLSWSSCSKYIYVSYGDSEGLYMYILFDGDGKVGMEVTSASPPSPSPSIRQSDRLAVPHRIKGMASSLTMDTIALFDDSCNITLCSRTDFRCSRQYSDNSLFQGPFHTVTWDDTEGGLLVITRGRYTDSGLTNLFPTQEDVDMRLHGSSNSMSSAEIRGSVRRWEVTDRSSVQLAYLSKSEADCIVSSSKVSTYQTLGRTPVVLCSSSSGGIIHIVLPTLLASFASNGASTISHKARAMEPSGRISFDNVVACCHFDCGNYLFTISGEGSVTIFDTSNLALRLHLPSSIPPAVAKCILLSTSEVTDSLRSVDSVVYGLDMTGETIASKGGMVLYQFIVSVVDNRFNVSLKQDVVSVPWSPEDALTSFDWKGVFPSNILLFQQLSAPYKIRNGRKGLDKASMNGSSERQCRWWLFAPSIHMWRPLDCEEMDLQSFIASNWTVLTKLDAGIRKFSS
jgi:hypothetical protein